MHIIRSASGGLPLGIKRCSAACQESSFFSPVPFSWKSQVQPKFNNYWQINPLNTYLFLMLVKVVSLLSEWLGWDHHVRNWALKVLMVLDIVEELVAEHFHLVFVHVGKHFKNRSSQKLDHCLLVWWKGVWLLIHHINRLHDRILLNQSDQLLKDLTLDLEPREMAAVWHHA